MNITISNDAEQRLWSFIESVSTEIGGFGYAVQTEDGFNIEEVFLVPQQVSGSEVEFTGNGISHAIERAANDGVLGEAGFCWVSWHSHHTMKAFWSGTDEECIETYGGAGVPHLISFVGCHNRDYRLRYDAFGVKHNGVTIPQVTIDKIALLTPRLDAVADEIKQFVTKKKIAPMKQKFVKPVRKNDPGAKLEEVFEENGYFVGPAGLVEYGGFDDLAWDAWSE